jgi:hypothetical protein
MGIEKYKRVFCSMILRVEFTRGVIYESKDDLQQIQIYIYI